MSKNTKGGLLGSILTGDMGENASLQMQTAANDKKTSEQTRKLPDRVKELDPNKCRLWQYADRPENEAEHAQEIASSMDDVDQISPVIAREISIDDPDYPNIEYEIIAGSVRWRAAKLRDKPLKAIIKSLSDKEALAVMIVENEHRRGISAFSRSLQLQKTWQSGMFESQDELASVHRIEKSKASMYLKVAVNESKLRELYGENITSIGLRQLYDSCNFEKPEEQADKKASPSISGVVIKKSKAGITTIKFATNISEEKLSKIKSIIEESEEDRAQEDV